MYTNKHEIYTHTKLIIYLIKQLKSLVFVKMQSWVPLHEITMNKFILVPNEFIVKNETMSKSSNISVLYKMLHKTLTTPLTWVPQLVSINKEKHKDFGWVRRWSRVPHEWWGVGLWGAAGGARAGLPPGEESVN